MNCPEAMTQVFDLANTRNPQSQRTPAQNAELIREVGLKCISFNGIPRTINTLGAFFRSLPPDVASALATTPTRDLTPENIETRKKDGGVNTGLFTGSPAADKAIREEWVTESGNAGFDQVISTYYDVVDYGQSFGSSPAGQEIQNELNNAITAALLGDKSPEEALKDAQKAAMRAYENIEQD